MSLVSLPPPVFEGSEKRLELDFSTLHAASETGLRQLTRRQIDSILDKACCCVVSSSSNEDLDAYVLSESSLFIYPTKAVLKTCGTTRLLEAVPVLLELAAVLGLSCCRCKYSRASFLFPDQQPKPYQSFSTEAAMLTASLSKDLGSRGAAFVLGDALAGLQWHVYLAELPAYQLASATYNLEVCMTSLCPLKAGTFCRTAAFLTAASVTAHSGISALLPGALVDDFIFDPCGYSMNALRDATFSTIHVTPEEACSYASFELSGPDLAGMQASDIVAKVAQVFSPQQMTVTLSVSASSNSWGQTQGLIPSGFYARGCALQHLPHGGHVAFYSLQRAQAAHASAGMAQPQAAAPYQDFASFSSEDTIFSSKPSADQDQEMHAAASAASSRAPSPMPVASLLHPCPMLHGQSSNAIAKVLAKYAAMPIPSNAQASVDAHIRSLVQRYELEDPLFVLDLGCVMRLYNAWQLAMPRVQPFYAVKCNTDAAMIDLLAALGAGFDCASEAEVRMVLRAGVPPERIVYANACKRPKDIRAAVSLGVDLTTFDTVSELHKLHQWHPGTAALLRIRADDPAARCQLGNKYGAEMSAVPGLLQTAQTLGINVTGVSFHVGSGATNPAAFSEAIALARDVFNQGLALGCGMHVLDIGGGFCGGALNADGSVELGGVPAAVNAALALHFPDQERVRVIAEPGRYFAEACASLACMVIGTRDAKGPGNVPSRDYWITDGLYGSMNCILYDHATLTAHRLPGHADAADASGSDAVLPSTVFGPTCDGLDTVLRDWPLPQLQNGDWLVFPNMGAYTLVGACNFNGIDVISTPTFYVCSPASA